MAISAHVRLESKHIVWCLCFFRSSTRALRICQPLLLKSCLLKMVILACEKCPRSKSCLAAKPQGSVNTCRDPSHAEIRQNRLSIGEDACMPPFEGMSKLERTHLRAAGEATVPFDLRLFKVYECEARALGFGSLGISGQRPQDHEKSSDVVCLWTLSTPRLKSCFARFRKRYKRHPCGVASTAQCHRNYMETIHKRHCIGGRAARQVGHLCTEDF